MLGAIRHLPVRASTYLRHAPPLRRRLSMAPLPEHSAVMRALVYSGKGKVDLVQKPLPQVQDATDAVVKMTRTTICGTDLHIIRGDVPTATPDRTLGHEGLGIIDQVGDAVRGFRKGDRVLISCITACGACTFCRRSMYDQCRHGGWRLGNTIDGTQAEYVRIPFATMNLYHIPPGVPERNLLAFSDIVPTSLEVGAIRGGVRPGCTVAIVGAGPIGLAAILTARLYSPRKIVVLDRDEKRLKIAREVFGADDVINTTNCEEKVRELASKHFEEIDGFDVVMEAVGHGTTFQMCQDLVGVGGSIANIGVHGAAVGLDIDRLWSRSNTISMALVSTYTLPMLLQLAAVPGKLDTSALITHDFKFADMKRAYDVFGDASHTGALKLNVEF